MTYLVDTDRVVDYLKGRPDAQTLLQGILGDGIAISIITYGEVYEGIYYGSDPRHNEAVFRAFLRGVRVIGISQKVARTFAQLRGRLRRQGLILPMLDLLIAATAIEHNLSLVTRNRRDFERVPGLKMVPSP